ncbi:MAG: Fic family protein [bacterium]
MKSIQGWLQEIEEKRARLESLGGLPTSATKNLDQWFRVELTYTSNAIEGNTLSRAETALVVDKGITVAGKSIREHLEAVNHAEAWEYIKQLVQDGVRLGERELLDIHSLILQKIDEVNAGRYRSVTVRIAGSRVILPNPIKVPDLMDKYFSWLGKKSENKILQACEAHYRLVSIHPFTDGNGRTARLVMNLLLLMAGYPPIIVRKEDRHEYLTGLELAQLGGTRDKYYQLMLEGLSRSMDIYLGAAGIERQKAEPDKLLKVGELATLSGESVATIRHWTKMGLLLVSGYTKGGYQLYDHEQIKQIKTIRELQKEKRLSLEEIGRELAR